MKAKVKKAKNGEWYWTLVARNGRNICTPGETFKTRYSAERNLQTVTAAFNKSIDTVYE